MCRSPPSKITTLFPGERPISRSSFVLLKPSHRISTRFPTSASPFAIAHRSMMRSLASFFTDPRLIQLFGRYATYVGSSPYEAPGTLALIAHVEREGVHYVQGGMARLASALEALAVAHGVRVRYGTSVRQIRVQGGAVRSVVADDDEIPADVVVHAGDVAALASGLLGPDVRRAVSYDFAPAVRSLSALTLATVARASGFPLVRHNVFFGADSRTEFDDLFERGRLPESPTVYVCAQDRTDGDEAAAAAGDGYERLFFIVNAPARADTDPLTPQEIQTCEKSITALLASSNLTLEHEQRVWTTPTDFADRYPGSAGAIYGRASHGMMSALNRPGARTKVRGLYVAGGTVHPGAGVPMAALSGIAAARAIQADSASTERSKTAATAGSTSTA